MSVAEHDEVVHANSRLPQQASLQEWEAMLKWSKGKDVTASDGNRELLRVRNQLMSLEEMAVEADVIAVISARAFIAESKYHKVADPEIKEVYRNETGVGTEMLHTALFAMPPSMELRVDYLVFMQHDRGNLYTLTLEGSMIPRGDAAWEEAIAAVQKSVPQ